MVTLRIDPPCTLLPPRPVTKAGLVIWAKTDRADRIPHRNDTILTYRWIIGMGLAHGAPLGLGVGLSLVFIHHKSEALMVVAIPARGEHGALLLWEE